MKKIRKINKYDIVLGSSGFIAQYFIKRNENKQKHFICFDKKDGQYNNKNILFYKLDINKYEKIKKVLLNLKKKDFNTIWHFAANSDISKSNSKIEIDYHDTFCTTFLILKLIQELNLKIKNIFFSSSSAIYGAGNTKHIENSVEIKTISNYGAMKLSSEAILSSFCYLNKIKCKIFRFPNVIGSNMSHGLIYDLKKKIKKNKNTLKILGNGTQTKQYLHVDDLMDAIFVIKNRDKNKFKIYNIGPNDHGISVKKIVKIFLKINKINPKVIYGKNNFGWKGDIPKFKLNTNLINNLGWRPKLKSQGAIVKTIQENKIIL